MQTYFVTGTDTDVGKTVATVLVLKALNKVNKKTLGIKPISAGCAITEQGLRNDDALALQAASSIKVDYELVNPIAYQAFIAPHIAAMEAKQEITLDSLQECLEAAKAYKPEQLLVEGAGGWRLPLNNDASFYSDFAIKNRMKVILVVGMRLGCLNHALLTQQAIESDGLQCAGWIANQLSPDMPYYDENLHTLDALLACPRIAEIPYQQGNPSLINTNQNFLQVFA